MKEKIVEDSGRTKEQIQRGGGGRDGGLGGEAEGEGGGIGGGSAGRGGERGGEGREGRGG